MRLSHTAGDARLPVIAWQQDHFVVGYEDWSGRYPAVGLLEVGADGAVGEPRFLGMERGAAMRPVLSVDGRSLGWLQEGSWWTADGEGGAPVRWGTGVRAGAVGPYGAAAWNDARGLWWRSDGMVWVSDQGRKPVVFDPVAVATGQVNDPTVAWNGEIFAVVWSQAGKGGWHIRLQRFAPGGDPVGPVVSVSTVPGVSRHPKVVWTGSDFAVAWTHRAPMDDNPTDRYEVFLAFVPARGNRPRATTQLQFRGSSDQVDLAAGPDELAVVWLASTPEGGSVVMFLRVDPTGVAKEPPVRISDDGPVACGPPAVAWSPTGYGVVWHDDRLFENTEVFFTRLACGAAEAAPLGLELKDADAPQQGESGDATAP